MEERHDEWVIKRGVVYDLKTDSKVYTPITARRMERWISEGRVKEDHLVWRSGFSGWRRAGDIEELKPLFGRAKREPVEIKKGG